MLPATQLSVVRGDVCDYKTSSNTFPGKTELRTPKVLRYLSRHILQSYICYNSYTLAYVVNCVFYNFNVRHPVLLTTVLQSNQ